MNRMKPYIKGGIPFDIESFRNVPIELAPVYGWNFNDRLERETIKTQIDDMQRAGIRAFYVLPEPKNFRTTIPTNLEPEYLSDEYMEYFAFASEYAKKKGMLMWLYDEGGWPSGSACGEVYKRDKSTAKKHLGEFERIVKKGESYEIPCNAIGVFKDRVRIKEGFTAQEEVRLKEYRLVDDSVQYTEVGNRKTPYTTVVAFEGNTDIMEQRTVDLFLDITHERYRRYFGKDFGTHMTMMFTDEPRPGCPAWFSGIEKLFYEKYGYDILEHLPALFSEDEDDGSVRIDYRTLCGETLKRVFFDSIRNWCHKNDLLFSGHVDQDNLTDGGTVMNYGNTLDLLRSMDVPGVDVIWRQIYPYKDGRRVEKGCPFFPRMAVSAAAQNGGNISITESLGVYGLGVGMDEMRYVFNYQAIRGISIMNPLLISYGTREHFAFGERPYFNGEIPGHDDLKLINECYSRVSYLVSIGRRNVRCALYISTEDMNAGGTRCSEFVRNFDALGSMLEKSGIDFDIIDSKGILNGEISNGFIHIGAAAYDTVIVPEGTELSEEVNIIISCLHGTPMPLLKSDIGFENLRVSSRRFDNGDMLYLLFNEGNTPMETYVEIPDSRPSYILDTTFGCVYNSEAETDKETSRVKFSLQSGELLGVLFTNEIVNAEKRSRLNKTIILSDFEVRAVHKFIIDKSGFYDVAIGEEFRPLPLGSWESEFGCDFSGEVEYRTFFELDEVCGEYAKLSLGKLCCSASVYVNDIFVGCAGLSPCEVKFKSELLNFGKNKIVVRVANTAANQMLYSDAEDNYTAYQLTPYNDRARNFESESLESGLFGPVILSRE